MIFDTGNYLLHSGEGNKKQVGTIPSELGQLKLWKHIVLGEFKLCADEHFTVHFMGYSACNWFLFLHITLAKYIVDNFGSGTIPIEFGNITGAETFWMSKSIGVCRYDTMCI